MLISVGNDNLAFNIIMFMLFCQIGSYYFLVKFNPYLIEKVEVLFLTEMLIKTLIFKHDNSYDNS